MTIDSIVWEYEKARLERVIEEIGLQFNQAMEAVSNYRKEAIEVQRKMWDEAKSMPQDMKDLDGPAQAWQYQVEIDNQARKYKLSHRAATMLERLCISPYFGRIDFLEEGEDRREEIYIGLHNLNENKTGEFLIFDWRAPISSMFYDYELGESSYRCPAGTIRGEISLKRQYRIEDQKIVYMFDSSLTIQDEWLQQMLGKSVDNRMKNIVTSIQREQNSAIRNCDSDVLVVQGAAGSGKTSIALHRAAYILYRYREELSADNIIIFSPNTIFNDYISNVLPELGEDDLKSYTFLDYFESALDDDMIKESFYQQMEYILCCRNSHDYQIRLEAIKYKSSVEFINLLKRYVNYLEEGSETYFKDIYYNDKLIMSKEEMKELFTKDYGNFSLFKRMAMIGQRANYLLKPYEEIRLKELTEEIFSEGSHITGKEAKVLAAIALKKELKPLKNEIEEITSLNIYQIYINLFEDNKLISKLAQNTPQNFNHISKYTISSLSHKLINYEDLAPILYLKGALDSPHRASGIKHVIIDESQDYTILQMEVLKQTFGNSKMTIVGDLNQSINNYMNIGEFNNITEVFNKRSVSQVRLLNSYRSTKEITDFCTQILPSSASVHYLNRRGQKPKVINIKNSNGAKVIVKDIVQLQNKGHEFIAVICKSHSQSLGLYKDLKEYINITLIADHEQNYPVGIVILPSYLAKGLEFDAVLIYGVGEEDYCREDERKLLYTVCTRALHDLYLYYQDKLSPYILEIDPQLYEKIIG